MKYFILSLLTAGMLIGCKSTSSDLPEIILPLNAPEIQVKVSDLADNVRLVPLETNDSSLLPGGFNILISKDYILALSQDEIQQFDRQGKHIRRLATKGRGPEEYQTYYSAFIDEPNGLLYLSEWDSNLSSYNLHNGAFAGRKTMPFPIGQILEIRDDTLLCQVRAYPRDTTKYSLCLMTLKGEILDGLPHRHIAKDFDGIPCYKLPDGTIRLLSDGLDTLYTVRQFQKSPYVTIKCTENDDPKFSLIIIPYFENSRWHLINVRPMYLEKDQKGKVKFATLKDVHCFLVDKRENTGKHIEELYVDTLGISIPLNGFSISEYFTFPITASVIKEIAEKQLEKDSISPALQALYDNTKEEDNPILLIGACKP